MDNLGDWIYIVFLIVAAVSGLFSSKKNKKRPTQVLGHPVNESIPEEDTTSDKGFWEILEEVKKTQPRKQAPTIVQTQKKKKIKDKPSQNPFLTAESEIQRSKAASSRPVDFPTEEDSSLLEDVEFNNLQELRKAVIYSEILNRKY